MTKNGKIIELPTQQQVREIAPPDEQAQQQHAFELQKQFITNKLLLSEYQFTEWLNHLPPSDHAIVEAIAYNLGNLAIQALGMVSTLFTQPLPVADMVTAQAMQAAESRNVAQLIRNSNPRKGGPQ